MEVEVEFVEKESTKICEFLPKLIFMFVFCLVQGLV